MRAKIYVLLTAVAVIATAALAVAHVSWLWIAAVCAITLVLLVLAYRAVLVPLQSVENGMYLLRSQDFSSRLRKTGQHDADRIVDLFNTLMATMKAERLKNLEQDRFLNLVVEASPMGIAVCNFDGGIVQTNKAWRDMYTPALADAIDAVPAGETQTVRLAHAMIVRISRLWFMDCGFRRNFILVERLTDEIAEAEKQLFSKIVRTIGHEVNNTMGSVTSVLETLGQAYDEGSLEGQAVESCQSSCANLVSFVRGYADIVKLPAPVPEEVSVSGWLRQLFPVLQPFAGDGIDLRLDLPEKDYKVPLDAMLMERVMVNIVKNAAESVAGRTGGFIAVSLTASGRPGFCRLQVTDNGKGIPAELSAKIFTSFFSTKRPDRGLGLMLVADILREHRFGFSLSTSPLSGLTSFVIEMPVR